MSGSGRVALLDVREWLRDPPRCLAVIGRPFQMSGSGGRPSWMYGRPHGCPGVVGRPYRMSGSGRETVPDVRKCTEGYPGCPGGPLGCPGVVGRPSRKFGRPSRMSGNGMETLPVVRK